MTENKREELILNYMPLARMAMYSKDVDSYLAPTADARDSWQATLRHIACEGRCFVLGCNQFVASLNRAFFKRKIGLHFHAQKGQLPRAGKRQCLGQKVEFNK